MIRIKFFIDAVLALLRHTFRNLGHSPTFGPTGYVEIEEPQTHCHVCGHTLADCPQMHAQAIAKPTGYRDGRVNTKLTRVNGIPI